MKIKEIRAAPVKFPERRIDTQPRRPSWSEEAEVANPVSRYPEDLSKCNFALSPEGFVMKRMSADGA